MMGWYIRQRERFEEDRNIRNAGFTLVELLVVIAILGILAAIVVFSVAGINNKGQTASCQTDTQELRTAEEAYYAQNGTYVAYDSGTTSGTPLVGTFLDNNSNWHAVEVATSAAGVTPVTYSTLGTAGTSTVGYQVVELTAGGTNGDPCAATTATAGTPVNGTTNT